VSVFLARVPCVLASVPCEASAVLLPREDLLALLTAQRVIVIWPDGAGFEDTADGELVSRSHEMPILSAAANQIRDGIGGDAV
jgi:hypothetical protein